MLKSEIRALFKEKREGLSFLELNRKSQQITDLILKKIEFKNKQISIFLPIEKQKEFNSFPLLEQLIIKGAIPIISKSNFQDCSLTLYKYESASQLNVNSYGIPEPKHGEVISDSQLNVVFVPLLAIDKMGNRIGYGKGFYDRLLAKCSPECLFIGINLFDEFIEIDDLNPYDIQLHSCFTPQNYYEFR